MTIDDKTKDGEKPESYVPGAILLGAIFGAGFGIQYGTNAYRPSTAIYETSTKNDPSKIVITTQEGPKFIMINVGGNRYRLLEDITYELRKKIPHDVDVDKLRKKADEKRQRAVQDSIKVSIKSENLRRALQLQEQIDSLESLEQKVYAKWQTSD